jgi:hypothetical protein
MVADPPAAVAIPKVTVGEVPKETPPSVAAVVEALIAVTPSL